MNKQAFKQSSRAWQDWIDTYRKSYVWTHQAFNDVRVRYRRSGIGPWWITIQTAVTLFFLGAVYSELFNVDLATYLPYLAVSIILWYYASSVLSEGCSALIEAGPMLLRLRIPIPSIFLRILLRTFLVFLHNVGLIFVVLVVFNQPPFLTALWALPGFVLFFLNLSWMAIVLAILGVRYRDVQPMLAAVLSLLLLITPIFWNASLLPNRIVFVEYNPFYHFLQLVRMPLLGSIPDLQHWIWGIAGALLGWTFALFLYRVTYNRLVLWV